MPAESEGPGGAAFPRVGLPAASRWHLRVHDSIEVCRVVLVCSFVQTRGGRAVVGQSIQDLGDAARRSVCRGNTTGILRLTPRVFRSLLLRNIFVPGNCASKRICGRSHTRVGGGEGRFAGSVCGLAVLSCCGPVMLSTADVRANEASSRHECMVAEQVRLVFWQ